MRDVKFGQEELNVYFNKWFLEDLSRYFHVQKNAHGEELIHNIQVRGEGYIPHTNILKRHSGFFFFLIPNPDTPVKTADQEVTPDGTLEEEFMFMGLCSALYMIGEYMSYHNKKEMWQRMMSTKKLPLFDAEKNIYSLSDFLMKSEFLQAIRFKKGIITTKEAINQSLDFLFNLFDLSCIAGLRLKYFKKSVDSALVPEYRKLCDSPKLTVDDSIDSGVDFQTYYQGRFKSDLIKYFDLPVSGCVETISNIDYLSVGRWEDGNPAGNTRGNMFFSSVFLNMYLAQQAVIKVVSDEAREAFTRVSGRPWILTGPGGGDRLFALKALEYAGLLPAKFETAEYLKALAEVNEVMNADMDKMLEDCGLSAYKDAILAYLDEHMKQVVELLKDWETAPEDQMYEFIPARGIDMMIGY